MAANDFYAMNVLQGAVPALQDDALARTEGGSFCVANGGISSAVLGGEAGGGVSLCSTVGVLANGGATFSVSNAAPVTGANFLQVIGGTVGAP
jgi:hypothetical protein